MKSRKLWLAVAVLAIAGFAATPLLGADVFRSHLAALEETATIGSTTPLGVEVAPMLVGGTGDLYATTKDGQVATLGSFALHSTSFVLDAPVPAIGCDGQLMRYYFRSCGPDGEAFDLSTGAVVLLKGGQGTDEPPAWK